jgi:hypothetical protein
MMKTVEREEARKTQQAEYQAYATVFATESACQRLS